PSVGFGATTTEPVPRGFRASRSAGSRYCTSTSPASRAPTCTGFDSGTTATPAVLAPGECGPDVGGSVRYLGSVSPGWTSTWLKLGSSAWREAPSRPGLA